MFHGYEECYFDNVNVDPTELKIDYRLSTEINANYSFLGFILAQQNVALEANIRDLGQRWDGSSDEGKREHFAVLVRFTQSGTVKKAFNILILHTNAAESLTMVIESFLLAKGVYITRAIFVRSDDVNTMSGVHADTCSLK